MNPASIIPFAAAVAVLAAAGPATSGEPELLGAPPSGVHHSHSNDPAAGRGPCARLAFEGRAGDYVAGTGAAGQPVAPADVEDRFTAGSGPVIAFDLPLGRGRRANRSHDISAGSVEVDTATGAVGIDGVAIGDRDLEELRRHCATR